MSMRSSDVIAGASCLHYLMIIVQMEADSCEIKEGERNQICKIESLHWKPVGLKLVSLPTVLHADVF